jgi:hypothetical protein
MSVSLKANGSVLREEFPDLPPGNFFAVYRLAKILDRSRQHIGRLIDDGDLKVPIDVRRRASSRSSILVPRASVIEFLERRKITPALNGNGTNGHNGRNGKGKH